MEEKVRKLREKLGLSAKDQQETAGTAISPNLRKKISTDPKPGGNFLSAITDPKPGGNFLSAITDPKPGGNFLSAIGS